MKVDLVALIRRSEQRFWPRVDKRAPDECWQWKGIRNKGYGQLFVGIVDGKNVNMGAHRAAFALTHDYLPLFVRHSCDNAACCNPGHLLAGNHRQNMDDVIARKRQAGARNGNAKLSDDDVKAIRSARNISNVALGKKFGVTKQMISLIKCGKSWTHVS